MLGFSKDRWRNENEKKYQINLNCNTEESSVPQLHKEAGVAHIGCGVAIWLVRRDPARVRFPQQSLDKFMKPDA